MLTIMTVRVGNGQTVLEEPLLFMLVSGAFSLNYTAKLPFKSIDLIINNSICTCLCSKVNILLGSTTSSSGVDNL